jgi:acyl dehydratase
MTLAKILSDYAAGEALPTVQLGQVSRHQLALYCGGSGDHNPLHTDIDFARDRAGLPDVIAHGMLTMALAGRVLSQIAPPEALRSYRARFVDKTHIGETLRCEVIVERRDADDVELALRVFADQRLVMTGSGVIALAGRNG